MYKKKIFKIAIVGLGNIGSYLYEYLNKNKNILISRNNVEYKVAYVSAKNFNKKRKIKFKKKSKNVKVIDLIIKTSLII